MPDYGIGRGSVVVVVRSPAVHCALYANHANTHRDYWHKGTSWKHTAAVVPLLLHILAGQITSFARDRSSRGLDGIMLPCGVKGVRAVTA